MKKVILLLGICFLFALKGFSQQAELYKLDASLRYQYKKAQENPLLKKTLSQKTVHVFIRGEQLESLIASQNGQLRTPAAGWYTANIPFTSLSYLIQQDNIQKIKQAPGIYFRNDQVLEHTRAAWVHEGQSPLASSYTGKGVIVGIIDSGIDVDHADFQNTEGTSRILYLWDQNVEPANSPPNNEGYDYGREWTQAQINAGLCTHEDVEGHGTHVAGTAAGNGLAVNNYKGTAPDAHLIVVAISPFSASFVDAASYIYQKADALGMPCVINASLGWHTTYHDGTDADALMIDAMVEEKSGRIFCAAAGNEGSDFIHVTPVLTSEEKYTYYFTGPDGLIQLRIRIPNDFLETTAFAIGVDESDINPEFQEGSSLAFKGKTSWYTAKDILDNAGIYKNLTFDMHLGGRVSFEAEAVSDSVTGLMVIVEEDSLNWDSETGEVSDLELWRLYVKQGNPRIDIWIADMGYSFWDFPNTADYLVPNNVKSVGMPAVAHKIIAVGASVNRNEFTNKFGEKLGSEAEQGALAVFSSRGPTADNRMKPEIVAPGEMVISAMAQASYDDGYVFDEDIAEGEKHVVAGGTSMASPAVAGCIALYLEKYPEADYEQVISALQFSARTDGFTGNYLPDNVWGYGKTDIHKMLQSTFVKETEFHAHAFTLSANYPNPFNPYTTIYYILPYTQHVRVRIFNTKGQEISVPVDEMQSAGRYDIRIDGSFWANGIYFYQLETQVKTLTRKMVLMK